MVSNAASALGEAIGTLFETAIIDGLRADVEKRGYTISPAKLKNGTGNVYQIDAVIFDSKERPVVIIDPKYIRYTKHNRDKGSWLCVAHYNLRKTFPTIRKSIAILAGRWSRPSVALIHSFGVETIEVPFQDLVDTLKPFAVEFHWAEKDRATPISSWEAYSVLDSVQRATIGTRITAGIMDRLRSDVLTTLDTDLSTLPRRVSTVEVLLKTDQNEMLLSEFDTIAGALRALADLVSDKPDISTFIGV